jgi:hypothetical protein
MNSTDAAPKKNAPRRRSQRVMLSVRLLVSGNRPTGHAFSEEVSTVVVNAHGALILAAEPLHVSQLVIIKHLKSGEEQMCRVVQIETAEAGMSEVALEFLEPAPRFWRVSFPPEDWSANSPEAKQITAPPIPVSKPVPVGANKLSRLPQNKKLPWK